MTAEQEPQKPRQLNYLQLKSLVALSKHDELKAYHDGHPHYQSKASRHEQD